MPTEEISATNIRQLAASRRTRGLTSVGAVAEHVIVVNLSQLAELYRIPAQQIVAGGTAI
jgi:hypothetical protein